MLLAPYATHAAESRGRLIAEAASPTRGPYQRDRDRIIHCGAFRRLRNKTQVFIESENDYFRTRLTHSLEVAQIARTMARQLQADEDLAEALALAHDLGHTCFGHAGETALDKAMHPHGSFDHNEQTFRILTLLERRYANFNGLNLTWETLEGIVKHNGPVDELPPTLVAFQGEWDLEFNTHAGLEAQIAALSDDIAYNTHDFDDGFGAGFFKMEELEALPIFGPIYRKSRERFKGIEEDRLMREIVREAIGVLVQDVLAETRKRLAEHKPANAVALRGAGVAMVAFSSEINEGVNALRQFLFPRVYRHEKVRKMNERAGAVVAGLYTRHFNDPASLPPEWHRDLVQKGLIGDKQALARHVADYVAGMTDRYAELEYRRLFEE